MDKLISDKGASYEAHKAMHERHQASNNLYRANMEVSKMDELAYWMATTQYLTEEAVFLRKTKDFLDKELALREAAGQAEEEQEPPTSLKRPYSMANPTGKFSMFFDGASKGNPGAGGSGWALIDDDLGVAVAYGWGYEGNPVTNNLAEYKGLLRGLRYVEQNMKRFTHLSVFGDSSLVINQVNGTFACKAPHLVPLHQEVQTVLAAIWKKGKVQLRYLPRAQNAIADKLSNLAVQHENTMVSELGEVLTVEYLHKTYGLAPS